MLSCAAAGNSHTTTNPITRTRLHKFFMRLFFYNQGAEHACCYQ
jgi:hypothetical protein